MTHVVVYGTSGQTLRHVAPEVISSATYELVDLNKAQDNSDRVLASGSATVPSFTLTTDAAAGPSQADPQRIPVTLTAGPSAGDVVVVTNSAGAFEAVTVESIATNDAVNASSFLARTYASGSTVQGVTITCAVDIALYNFELALDDQRPLAVIWTYAVAAGERVVVEPIQLTRTTTAVASLGVAMETVRRGHPDLPGQLATALTLEALAAFSLAEVRADLDARGVDDAALLGSRVGHQLLVSKILHEAASRGYAPGQRPLDDYVIERERDYDAKLSRLTIGTAGRGVVKLDTEAQAHERPDSTYRSPISAA